MITIEHFRGKEEFQSLRQSWDQFMDTHFPEAYYLNHDWLAKWCEAYGGEYEVIVSLAYDNSTLVGIVPLVLHKENYGGFPVRRLGFLGMGFGKEDFPILSDHQAVLTEVFLKLASLIRWDVVSFARLGPEAAGQMRNVAAELGYTAEETEALNPVIEMTTSFEEYFKSRSRNFRANCRKKNKRIKSWGTPEMIHHEEFDLKELPAIMEEIAQDSWQGEKGVSLAASDAGRDFLKLMVENFTSRGIVDATILKLNDEPIAYLLGARLQKTYFAIETAYKQKFFDVSPGMLLHLEVIERLYERKEIELLDFGYDAPYKRKWTENNRSEQQMTLYNRTLYPRFIHFFRGTKLYARLLEMNRKRQTKK